MDKVEKPNYNIINEIWELLTKTWIWLSLVGIGIVGKFGMYLQSGKNQSLWALVGSTLIAGFIGYLASIYCMIHYPCEVGKLNREAALIVPVATLMSDRLITIVSSLNWTTIIELLLQKSAKDKKDKK